MYRHAQTSENPRAHRNLIMREINRCSGREEQCNIFWMSEKKNNVLQEQKFANSTGNDKIWDKHWHIFIFQQHFSCKKDITRNADVRIEQSFYFQFRSIKKLSHYCKFSYKNFWTIIFTCHCPCTQELYKVFILNLKNFQGNFLIFKKILYKNIWIIFFTQKF